MIWEASNSIVYIEIACWQNRTTYRGLELFYCQSSKDIGIEDFFTRSYSQNRSYSLNKILKECIRYNFDNNIEGQDCFMELDAIEEALCAGSK